MLSSINYKHSITNELKLTESCSSVKIAIANYKLGSLVDSFSIEIKIYVIDKTT